MDIKKIVIFGWNNFTASLADGIKIVHPNCEILCPDVSTEDFESARKSGYLDPLPVQKSAIYENADYIIIDRDPKDIVPLLKDIRSLIEEGTYIMDFQPIKTDSYSRITRLLGSAIPYISCYIFLDEAPSEFTIRGTIFRDKIAAVVCDTSTHILQEVRAFWGILKVKIVPTTAEFFDEIFAETSQTVSLLSGIYTHILQQDSWADTLFFGFYNKTLRSFISPVDNRSQKAAEDIVLNGDHIRRTLSFIKREMDKIDEMIDNEDIAKLAQYMASAQQFKNRI